MTGIKESLHFHQVPLALIAHLLLIQRTCRAIASHLQNKKIPIVHRVMDGYFAISIQIWIPGMLITSTKAQVELWLLKKEKLKKVCVLKE
jgi:hypothetical protein